MFLFLGNFFFSWMSKTTIKTNKLFPLWLFIWFTFSFHLLSLALVLFLFTLVLFLRFYYFYIAIFFVLAKKNRFNHHKRLSHTKNFPSFNFISPSQYIFFHIHKNKSTHKVITDETEILRDWIVQSFLQDWEAAVAVVWKEHTDSQIVYIAASKGGKENVLQTECRDFFSLPLIRSLTWKCGWTSLVFVK